MFRNTLKDHEMNMCLKEVVALTKLLVLQNL